MLGFSFNKKIKGESILHLKPATPVEIILIKDEEQEKCFYSKLIEVLSESEITVTPPRTEEGSIVKLSNKSEYMVMLKTSSGIFQNEIKNISYDIEDGVAITNIKFLGPTTKIQRRQSFRLKKEIDFKFGTIQEVEDKQIENEENLVLDGRTVDISSGGLKFTSKEDLIIGETIKIMLNIDGLVILALAIIIYKEAEMEKEEQYFSYKCKFENISKKYSEELSKYIFDIQRDLSKKGRIGN